MTSGKGGSARLLGVVLLVFGLPACTAGAPGSEDCEGPKLLAAGSVVATSCSPPGVSFRSAVYSHSCKRVHEDWIGDVLVPHGGQTEYEEARSLRGIDPEDAFLLVDRSRPCPLSVAVGRRPGDLPDFGRPRHPLLQVRPSSARPGEVVRVTLAASDEYIYGVDADLIALERTAVPRKHLLVQSLTTGRLQTIVPGLRTGIPDVGFVGSRTWRWRVPDLPPGEYRIRKELIAEEPEGAPVKERTLVVSASLEITR